MIRLRTPSVSARLMRNTIVVTGAALLIALSRDAAPAALVMPVQSAVRTFGGLAR